MSSHSSNIGAPDKSVINGPFTVHQVEALQQSTITTGSELLLRVEVRANGIYHQLLVGGYWSTSGFRLTMIIELQSTPPVEADGQQGTIHLRGLAISTVTPVMTDRIQEAVNNQDVSRPENPSEAFSRRKTRDDWRADGGDAAADPRT